MTIRIANAPVSWGIFEFEGVTPKYPYQMVLDEIRDTGYTGIELGPWGYLPTDSTILKDELAKRDISLLSAFVPVELVNANAHDKGLNHAMQVGKLLADMNANYIVLADDNGTVPELVQQAGRRKGSYLSDAQWDVYAAGVNKIAKRIFETYGLKIVFHHHGAGYVETPDEVGKLMERADPKLVGICLDTGHWHLGGGDAVQAIEQYGDRVRYLHLKDYSADIHQICLANNRDYFGMATDGIFCELGQGVVDFATILNNMTTLNYDGWAIVEQDILSDDTTYPKLAAQRNRDYLKGFGY